MSGAQRGAPVRVGVGRTGGAVRLPARVRRGVAAIVVAALLLAGCQAQQVEVSGSAPAERITAYEAMAEKALIQTEDLWGEDSVRRPVSVVLPATAVEFTELTGGAAASQNAPAVTVGTLAKAYIVVHPDSWDLLTPEGRQSVLTHEVTHLSMQGDGPVPRWFGEGLAEYTAQRGAARTPVTVAGSALDPVRRDELPEAWPDPGGNAGPERTRTNAWGTYAMSWLACVYISERWSEEHLVGLYEEVEGGTPLPQAMQRVLGMPEDDVLTGWQVWLRALVSQQ